MNNLKQYLNIVELETYNFNKNNTTNLLDIILIGSEKLISTSINTSNKQDRLQTGSIVMLNSHIILLHDYHNNSHISECDKSNMFDIVKFYSNIIDNALIFSDIDETITYLRMVKHDHANNYDLRKLVDGFLDEIYDKRLINFDT